MISEHSCNWKLLYLKVNLDILRIRLAERSLSFDANSPYPVTSDILDKFFRSFEEPNGEGELVVLP